MKQIRLIRGGVMVASIALIASGVGPTAFTLSSAAADELPLSGPPPGYVLDYVEDFDGVLLDEGLWDYRTDRKAVCANQPENVSVGEGLLHIALKKETVDGMPYTCGGIISKGLFGHGYYETRAKLWSDAGFHSAFWLRGLRVTENSLAVGGYDGPHNWVNEIDGFEIDGHAPAQVNTNTHYKIPDQTFNANSQFIGEDSGAAYHVYGFEWTSNEVKVYVDRELVGTIAYPGPHGLQQVWLTSLGFTPPVDDTNLPGEVTFDYFHYYAPVQGPESSAAILVDNDDVGYSETGAWSSTNDVFGYDDRDTRFTDQVGATANWSVEIPVDGWYDVQVWNPSFYGSSDSSARYEVTHVGGTTSKVLDQLSLGQRLTSLGVYQFEAASGASIAIEKTNSSSGSLRADAVLLTPTVMIDNSDPGYTQSGMWKLSSMPGWNGSSSVFTQDQAAVASWEVDPDRSGSHDVYAYLPHNSNSSKVASYTVTEAAAELLNVEVNQAAYFDGWVYLGTVDVSGAVPITVQVIGNSANPPVRADAVKIVSTTGRDSSAPSAPSSLDVAVTANPSAGKLSLTATWAPNSEPDVVGYRFYFDNNAYSWNPIRDTKFVLDGLRFNSTNVVAITAVDASGNESPPASETISTPVDTAPPAVPTGLSLEPLSAGLVASWVSTANAAQTIDLLGYHVYVDDVKITTKPVGGTAAGASGYRIGGLTNGQEYAIRVAAVDYSGNESTTVAETATPVYTVVVDNDGAGFLETGSWQPSTIKGWASTTTRASKAAGALARWTPVLESQGEYGIYAWVPQHANSATQARYSINCIDGVHTKTLSQTVGGNQWVYLDACELSAAAYVQLDNAGASNQYLRADAVKFVRLSTIVDNSDSGYSETGTWGGSSVPGWNSSTVRAANTAGAVARWTPTLDRAGVYDVYAWVPQHTNGAVQARYTINCADGARVITLSQTAGGNQWVLLDSCELGVDSSSYVELSNAGVASQYLRADALKFVPQ